MVKEGLINLDFADVRAVMKEMGKAMMGTGEASGEKRALTAAEAAIANPLIDDSSMRGAKGLLISITGGKDLTLFEVDEAATRIREEVDEHANIIVGATFDESLDGIIRVSVVATGTEASAAAKTATPSHAAGSSAPEKSRLAELTARLRSDNQRLAAQKQEAKSAASPIRAEQIDKAALAAIAEAVSPIGSSSVASATYGDVSVRPIPPKPSLFPDHEEPVDLQEPAPPTVFIPPAAERLPLRPPRMPDFDELPVPAQNEIRRARGETSDEHPQKARTSLLQRLANVGLGRRDEEHEAPVAGRSSVPDLSQMPSLPARKPPKPIPPEFGGDPVSEYGRRPAPQGLDSHGRTAPVPSQGSEDHLDIPAFLRRQAN
jgi:cell division protein FtsZ